MARARRGGLRSRDGRLGGTDRTRLDLGRSRSRAWVARRGKNVRRVPRRIVADRSPLGSVPRKGGVVGGPTGIRQAPPGAAGGIPVTGLVGSGNHVSGLAAGG